WMRGRVLGARYERPMLNRRQFMATDARCVFVVSFLALTGPGCADSHGKPYPGPESLDPDTRLVDLPDEDRAVLCEWRDGLCGGPPLACTEGGTRRDVSAATCASDSAALPRDCDATVLLVANCYATYTDALCSGA